MLAFRSGSKTIRAIRAAAEKLALFHSDRRGVGAIEFAFFAGMLSIATLNVVDISIYLFQRMEVETATQMGAQAAWKTCDLQHLPATTNCSGLTQAIQNAIQGTSLGSKVSLQSGSPTEGYYCANSSNVLQYVSDVANKPADCTAAGAPLVQPGDYITIQTTYSYAPLFPGITVGGSFPTPITRTTMMRLG
jgi:Flp pilus assembly protein TadG